MGVPILFIVVPATHATTLSFCGGLLTSEVSPGQSGSSYSDPIFITAYRRILEGAGRQLIADEELDRMIDTNDPFEIRENGPSEKAAILRGLNELNKLWQLQIDGKVILKQELLRIVSNVLLERRSAKLSRISAQSKAAEVRSVYLTGHDHRIRAISVSAEWTTESVFLSKNSLIISSFDLAIWEWGINRQLYRGRHTKGTPTKWALSPNGKVMATGFPDGEIVLWDLEELLQQVEGS
jgi:hypothetical protein